MKKIVSFLTAVVALSAGAHARSPMNLDVLQRDGYGVVPIKHPRLNELVVPAAVNGRALNLVLDTGWQAHGNGIALD